MISQRATLNPSVAQPATVGAGQVRKRLKLDELSVLGFFLLIIYILLAVAWCRRYNPGHLLWFCDIAVLLTAMGLLFRSRMLLTAQLTAVVLFHAVWNFDFWSTLVFGYEPIGATSYMFYADLGLLEKSLSLLTHLFIVPIALFGVYILGAPKKAWILQWGQTSLIFLLTYLFTVPEENINRMFGVEIVGVSPVSISPILYYVLMVTLPPFAIYLPTNRMITMVVQRLHRQRGQRSNSKLDNPTDARPDPGLGLSSRPHPLAPIAMILLGVVFSVALSYKAHNKYALDSSVFQIIHDDKTGLEGMPPANISTSVDEILFGDREAMLQSAVLAWPHLALPKQWSGKDNKMHPHTKSTLLEMKADDIPAVPQEVWLRGTRSVPGSAVWAFVASDEFYLQTYGDLPGSSRTFEVLCNVGGRGISEYVDPSTGEAHVSTPYNEILGNGNGGIYALGVVEVLGGRVVARSPFYLVKRRGISSPEDVWFTFREGTMVPLISNPDDPSHSRIAFQTFARANGRPEVHTCDFFGYKTRNLNLRGASYRLLEADGKLASGAGWVSGNLLQCFSESDGKPKLIRVEDP